MQLIKQLSTAIEHFLDTRVYNFIERLVNIQGSKTTTGLADTETLMKLRARVVKNGTRIIEDIADQIYFGTVTKMQPKSTKNYFL